MSPLNQESQHQLDMINASNILNTTCVAMPSLMATHWVGQNSGPIFRRLWKRHFPIDCLVALWRYSRSSREVVQNHAIIFCSKILRAGTLKIWNQNFYAYTRTHHLQNFGVIPPINPNKPKHTEFLASF